MIVTNKSKRIASSELVKNPMSIDLDYHALTIAVQKKDIASTRKILDSITTNRGFASGFKTRIYYLVGDYDRAVATASDWGIAEAMRPSRNALRNHASFKKYLAEREASVFWKKFGWPSVCMPVGDNDFRCE